MSEATKAFESICYSLRHVNLPCPAAHGQFAVGPPRVGIFIIPNGVDDGMLETLCLSSVATLPEFPCVDGYFRCLQGHGIITNNLHKARAHAWLASRPEPDRRVGEAAQAGYWPWGFRCCVPRPLVVHRIIVVDSRLPALWLPEVGFLRIHAFFKVRKLQPHA